MTDFLEDSLRLAQLSRFSATLMQNRKKNGEPDGPWQVRFNAGALCCLAIQVDDQGVKECQDMTTEFNNQVHEVLNDYRIWLLTQIEKLQVDFKQGKELNVRAVDEVISFLKSIDQEPVKTENRNGIIVAETGEHQTDVYLTIDPGWCCYVHDKDQAQELQTKLTDVFYDFRKERYQLMLAALNTGIYNYKKEHNLL